MPIESGASTASRSRQVSKIITNRPAGDRSAALRCIPTIAAYAHTRVRLDPRLALSGSAREQGERLLEGRSPKLLHLRSTDGTHVVLHLRDGFGRHRVHATVRARCCWFGVLEGKHGAHVPNGQVLSITPVREKDLSTVSTGPEALSTRWLHILAVRLNRDGLCIWSIRDGLGHS